MFKDAWLGCEKDLFVQDIGQHLRDLEHNDFDDEEVEHFHKLLALNAARLKCLSGKAKKLKWIFSQAVRRRASADGVGSPAR